jgi:hypothetical protein
MNPGKEIVLRYDNTGHHKELYLPTYPHHKHGDERKVRASSVPDLASVLGEEIETLVKLP